MPGVAVNGLPIHDPPYLHSGGSNGLILENLHVKIKRRKDNPVIPLSISCCRNSGRNA
jgi:hypothetical protein